MPKSPFPDDVTPEEVQALRVSWRKRLRVQEAARTARRIARRTETLFTAEARGIDPLTGEPFEDRVIDPLTGESWQGLEGAPAVRQPIRDPLTGEAIIDPDTGRPVYDRRTASNIVGRIVP